MAIFHSNGPGHIFSGVGASRALAYLGTSESGVRVEIRAASIPVPNDLAGVVSMDQQHGGEEAFVFADINRYNERVLAACMSRPNSAGVRGKEPAGSIGAFYITESLAYPLVIASPYAAKPVFAANGDPNGWSFAAAHLMGPDELEPLGTRYKKVRCVWHCISVYNPKDGSFSLYTNTTPTLPAID